MLDFIILTAYFSDSVGWCDKTLRYILTDNRENMIVFKPLFCTY